MTNADTVQNTEESLPIVYTTTQCMQCNMTKTQMDKLGVKYKVVEVAKDDVDQKNKFKEMGHKSFPVVVTGEDDWSGFRMEKIRALAQTI